MKKINKFFFPLLEEDEKLSMHDFIGFYGILGGAIVLTFYTWVVTL